MGACYDRTTRAVCAFRWQHRVGWSTWPFTATAYSRGDQALSAQLARRWKNWSRWCAGERVSACPALVEVAPLLVGTPWMSSTSPCRSMTTDLSERLSGFGSHAGRMRCLRARCDAGRRGRGGGSTRATGRPGWRGAC